MQVTHTVVSHRYRSPVRWCPEYFGKISRRAENDVLSAGVLKDLQVQHVCGDELHWYVDNQSGLDDTVVRPEHRFRAR